MRPSVLPVEAASDVTLDACAATETFHLDVREGDLSDAAGWREAEEPARYADADADAGAPALATFETRTADDDDPPFDPPDEDDEIFGELKEPPPFDEEDVLDLDCHSAAASPCAHALTREPERRAVERPAPSISIHMSWDHPEAAELCASISADRRMARAEITDARGGIDGAAARFSSEPSPDLLILDTTLTAAAMIAGLDRLEKVIQPSTKLVVIGAVNDVGLLRELARRGVSQYMLGPAGRDELISTVCELYAGADNSRVFAVVGARGGVGASTIAYNLAWSIAERQEATVSLVDLDLWFGAAAFALNEGPAPSIADALVAPERANDAFLERVAIKQTSRLHVLAAPASLEHEDELDGRAVKAVIEQVRRTSSFVVLDVPHRWSPWVKEVLLGADEVLIVATPDLASMRNTKNIRDLLKAGRSHDRDALVALSMVGAPKRPEISGKDFADAVGGEPTATFAFDPALFGLSEIRGAPIGETAPMSKIATALDALAWALTGRKPSKRKKAVRTPQETKAVKAVEAPEGKVEDQAWPPFTFAPAPVASDQDAPLVLVEAAPGRKDLPKASRRATKQRARRSDRSASELRPRPRGRPGTVRMAAALAALVTVNVWLAQSRGEASATATLAAQEHAPAPVEAPTAPPDPEVQYESALQLIEDSRVEEGVTLLRQAAEAGSSRALYRLAKLYETGAGVSVDLTLARRWTERAAEAGESRAMHDLGVYLAQGEGGPQDEVAAFRWFRQAAEFDIADSQYNLGLLYEQGRGVSADVSEALFWFLLAARQGDEEAVTRIAAVESQLSPLQVEQARARAEAFRPRAAAVSAD